MSDFIIDDAQLSIFIRDIAGAKQRVATVSAKWVKTLTNYTHKKMRSFSQSRSPRSTGKLSSSITSKYTLTGQSRVQFLFQRVLHINMQQKRVLVDVP
jgi:hypothetical protein